METDNRFIWSAFEEFSTAKKQRLAAFSAS